MYKLIVFFLVINNLFSQEYNGIVCDSITKKPLYNIELYTDTENTVTNLKGEFSFKTTNKNIFLKTVFMDRPKFFSLINFKQNDTIYVAQYLQLKEVTIISPNSILKKVLENFAKNYNTSKKYKSNMFVHSNLLIDDQPKLFLELASENIMDFEIYKNNASKTFFGTKHNVKTAILGLRKINQNKETILFKNSLSITNLINWGFDPFIFLEKGTTVIDNYEHFYVLHYAYKIGVMEYSGWYSVNKKDYAIIENYERKELILPEQSLLKLSFPKIEISHIFYDKKEGFPYYTRKLLLVNQEFLMRNKLSDKIEKMNLNFKIYNHNPTFDNLILKKNINNSYYKYVYDVEFPFEEAFWKNYNVPKSDFEKSDLYQNLELSK